MRLAFIGFRHGHVMGLYKAARAHPNVQVVAACEEHEPTAANLHSAGTVDLTHKRFDEMLKSVDCDAIAVGDYFSRRGSLILDSLRAGKHVIADKPICTSMEELEQIAALAKQTKRSIGCLLDLRDSGCFLTMRRLIREGAIGEVHTSLVTAQHPLLLATRPTWYYEDGKHGGTINDIGIHAIDILPWLTRQPIVEVVAARAWNARLPQHPKFQDAAQFLLRTQNNGSIFGDVSYLTPDGIAYSAPQYWRITCHGSDGLLETAYESKTVSLAQRADKSVRSINSEESIPHGALDAFLREIAGDLREGSLTTADVLDASRRTLLIQQAADRNATGVKL